MEKVIDSSLEILRTRLFEIDSEILELEFEQDKILKELEEIMRDNLTK